MDKYEKFIKDHGDNFDLSEFSIRPGTGPQDLDWQHFKAEILFRKWHGYPTMITSAFRPGDPNAHGDGLATDKILFYTYREHIVEPRVQWRLATTYPWMGVGLYFDWEFTDRQGRSRSACGIHTDSQTKEDRPLRWLRTTQIIDDEETELYYYQNPHTGLFYNKLKNELITLDDAIRNFWAA